ncbi:TMEM165/GDT1 family protein [Halovenus salina]|uniref:TMEM165/GDT1 family protein n=1 Tax=Halovenus salina TaxID=1510225 RepID=A0ABD5VUY2_9EURY|nr:TMEM165/GDT1 family protein [Halovenus salina]
MASFLDIVVIAVVAQLTVLPGEKVQLIIAGLSTRFAPYIVVAAAGAAFAGWTTLEIIFGEAIQRLLPGIVLDGLTAGLFLLFAVLLIRSMPADPVTESDVSETQIRDIEADFELFGHTIGGQVGVFLTIFAMMAAGEFGDKTQLVTINLAAQFGATPAIWVGEMLVIIPVSMANAYFFHRFSTKFDLRKAHLFGAALFTFFALDTFLGMATGPEAIFGYNNLWEAAVERVSDVLLAVV